jgi:outer membrane PBP1 activator LpoA protein
MTLYTYFISNHRFLLRTLFLSLLGGTLLWGCAGQPPAPTQPTEQEPGVSVIPPERMEGEAGATAAPTPEEDPARDLISNGRYLDAALLLIDLANSLPPPQRQDYQLRVASLLLQGNYVVQAEQILNEVKIAGLGRDYQVRKTLLGAQLALAKQSPNQALTQLQSLSGDIVNAGTDQQKEYYLTLVDVYTALGNYAASAQSRAALIPMLSDEQEKLENEETLLRDLQNLTPEELQNLEANSADITMQGWAGLAYVALSAQDEQQAQQLIGNWRAKYPSHEVESSIIDTIMAKKPEALGRPAKVALILPMTGRFAKAANAIRDGFLTAYYAHSDDAHRPEIRIYDEGNDPDQIQSVYDKAMAEGANFVVGPLSKKAVTNLYYSNDVKGGVLSLNYGDTDEIAKTGNFFQLSLSPEQEAVHVAEHAWLDGRKQAAAIFPNSAWGQRVFEAFKKRYEELGGAIVEYQTYDMRKNDYSAPIKRLLNLDESEKRYREIRRLVREKIEFEPRRRKDVDFIFMAAFARQGRLLRPQLKFHRAADIPVYATSHVYSGSEEPNMDRDMNGVRFSDMPWTLSDDIKHRELKQEIETTFPESSKRYMRLYALGIDAYNVIPELNRLRRNRFSSFVGETGTLYLDVANRLQRKLLWAKFVGGVPKVIQKF